MNFNEDENFLQGSCIDNFCCNWRESRNTEANVALYYASFYCLSPQYVFQEEIKSFHREALGGGCPTGWAVLAESRRVKVGRDPSETGRSFVPPVMSSKWWGANMEQWFALLQFPLEVTFSSSSLECSEKAVLPHLPVPALAILTCDLCLWCTKQWFNLCHVFSKTNQRKWLSAARS